MHESFSGLSSHSHISYFPAIYGAAHLWTSLNGALVWPEQPSAALSFQSPCSGVRLPPESCQDFPLFLHGNTFPSILANNSNILSHSTLGVSLLPSLLFISRLFPPMRCMSKTDFLCSQNNTFCF